MGILDKAKNAAEKYTGQAKEAAGKHTDDPELQAEGRKDQISGDLKNAAEHVKDAAENVKDALTR